MYIKTIFIILFIALIAACSSGPFDPDDLVGTYSILEKGKMKELIKIEKQDSTYTVSEKRNDKWREKTSTLELVTQEDFEKLLKRKVTEPFVGLKNKGVAIFKVSEDWQVGKFKTTTGYFMLFIFGPVELHKK